MFRSFLIISLFWFLMFSCTSENTPKTPAYTISELSNSIIEGGEPNLFVDPSGQVYLSWIEYLNDSTDALMFATLKNDSWTDPTQIAKGDDWFVNWADFPSLTAYKGGENTLAAHWLQKSDHGTYDYDIRISQSPDGGQSWSPSFILNTDGIAAEHGFLSMVPVSEDQIFATWLDGRNTKTNEIIEDTSHGHGGDMSLRCAYFDIEGNIFDEYELDAKVCDCCQTAAIMTTDGLVVAYRDRSDNEIRDISVVRGVNGEWTQSSTVFNDQWEIAGCPVNGPALDAIGNQVAIAWYTMAGEKPEVKLAFSNNGAKTFETPIRVDQGNPLGRVDIILFEKNKALVSWLEAEGEKAAVKMAWFNAEGIINQPFIIGNTTSSRRSGFPRIAPYYDGVIATWTYGDSLSKIKTVRIKF